MGGEQKSRERYKVKSEKNVFVTMRDGVRLILDIYRPDFEGQFPALLAMAVYGKDLQVLPQLPQSKHDSLLWDGCIEAGNTEYLVSRGYVHIIADARGTGDSEGEHIGINDKSEAEDGYDLVEWIAEQPWCDGNVGMIGISYFGIEQIFTASEQPPHLKAIFPFEVWYDLYRQVATEGGVITPMMYRLFSGRGMDEGPTNGSGYAPKNVVSATMKKLPQKELESLFQERLNDPDLRKYSIYWSVLRYPSKNPLFADILLNPNDGPFYWERTPYTKYDRIKVPVYTGGPWIPVWSEGAFGLYMGINTPKKIIMVQPGTVDRPWHQWHNEVMRWFDYWLKGIDTGIMDEPPIKLFVMGANQWRHEHEWPLARTRWTKFYLRSWGRLSPESPILDEDADCFVQEPLDKTSHVQSIKYSTAPLPEDMEITGPLAFYFYASINTDDTNWLVKLKDVDAYGSSRELTSSWLKASHRTIDESKSKTWRPWHLHTQREPVIPGKVYEYAIGLSPISNLFKTGHRIELEIASMDVVPGGLHICSSKTTLHRIYHDTTYKSNLLLPVIPKIKNTE